MNGAMMNLIGSFRDVPVVRLGDYHYFVHPLSDGIPLIDPQLLQDAASSVAELLPDPNGYDLLLTAESMGIPLTTAVSSLLSKPFSIVRKRKYGLLNELSMKQRTGYSSSDLHLNLPVGDGKIVVLDDVVSTGGTLRSVAEGVSRSGWEIIMAVVLFNKMGKRRDGLSDELGFPVRTVLDVEWSSKGFVVKVSENGQVPQVTEHPVTSRNLL